MNKVFNGLTALTGLTLLSLPLVVQAAPPLAQNDTRNAVQGISVTINVLSNDSDPDGDLLQVLSVSQPESGTVTINPDNSIRYTPDSTFSGSETITYTITDNTIIQNPDGTSGGLNTDTAQILIQVAVANLETEAKTRNDSRIGRAIDRFCGKIQLATEGSTEGQRKLAQRCRALYDLLNNGNGASVDHALAQIAGEEIAAQFDTANEFAQSHMKLISDRLLELRMSGASSSPISITLNNHTFDPMQAFSDPFSDPFADPFAQPTTTTMIGGNAGDEVSPFSKISLFLNGSIGQIEKDDTANEHGFESDTFNVTFGGDYRFRSNLIAGLAIGYTEENISFSNNGGGLDTEAYSYTLYGTWFKNRWTLEGVIGLGDIDYHSIRNTIYSDLSSSIQTSSVGDTNGDQWLASFTLSYDMYRSNPYGELYLNPFINLEYIDTDTNAFSEHGESAWLIHYDKQSYESILLSFGLFTSQAINLNYGVFTPQARFMAYQGFEDDPNSVSAYFINDANKNGFEFNNNSPDTYYMQAGVGGALTLTGGISLFIDYEKVIQLEHTDIDRLAYGLRWELDL